MRLEPPREKPSLFNALKRIGILEDAFEEARESELIDNLVKIGAVCGAVGYVLIVLVMLSP